MLPFLTQTVTVWNHTGGSPTVANTYQRTQLDRARYEEGKDGLVLYVDLVCSEAEQGRTYIEKSAFDLLEDTTGSFTFGPEDFIGLGAFVDALPSSGGKGQRKDWRVSAVLPRTAKTGAYLKVTAT